MKKNSINLIFLNNEAGEDEGLGHAGIETYRDAPYASVARECGQNSRDAVLKDPVVMSFDLLRIPTIEYPIRDEHRQAVQRCLEKARKKGDEKEIEFFEQAEAVLTGDEITLLCIADSNTKGLTGPAEAGKPFHSLLKGAGVSNKDAADSGGSFGIGKNAAFAVSELQAVFYSTIYSDVDDGATRFLAQGKTILISHSNEDGNEKRATGYWGMPSFMPIDDPTMVPEWMRRTEIGTTVIVAGFRESEDWQYRIAESLLQNFFCGIHRDEIRFRINQGQIEISKQTISELFEDERVLRAAEMADDLDDFLFAKSLYECLTSADSVTQSLDVDGLGPVSLTVLVREKLQKRVRIVRNGMAITDELGSFGDKFASFPMYRDFVALVEPASADGSKFLKRLENPRHDGLSAERLADPKKRLAAAATMKSLARKIRQAIKQQALAKPERQVALDELTEFFADRDPADKPFAKGNDENPEVLVYTPTQQRPTQTAEVPDGKAGRIGGKGTGKGTGGKGQGGGGGTGGGKGGRGKGGGPTNVVLDDFRNARASPASGWSRQLFFTPNNTCAAAMTVLAAGMEGPSELKVVRVDLGEVDKSGKLFIDLTAGTRHSLFLEFEEPYDGPIELTAAPVAGGAAP